MLLLPNDILQRGLSLLQVNTNHRSIQSQNDYFRANYGSEPEVLAAIWNDLCNTPVQELEASLEEKDKTEKGLKFFFVAYYFLWNYTKNETTLATTFKIAKNYARGEPLWRWVRFIAALTAKKIKWDPLLDDPNSEVFIVTVDGTNFRTTEKKHPTLNKDPKMFDKKSNGAGVKYEVAIAVFRSKVVSILGPFPASVHDMTVFRMKLKDQIPCGKLAIADGGYESYLNGEDQKLSIPNTYDSKALANFKTRARLRQETFNGRLKTFACLKQIFRHSIDKHKLAFEAVCVTVQYQMDNGAPLFDV